MNYQLTFLDRASSEPVYMAHLLDRSTGRLLAALDMNGQFSGPLPTGAILVSHVEYGRQPVDLQPGANIIRLDRSSIQLDPVVVRPAPRSGLPWWLWLVAIGAGGRALKLW